MSCLHVVFMTLTLLISHISGGFNDYCNQHLEADAEERIYSTLDHVYDPYWKGYKRSVKCKVVFRCDSDNYVVQIQILEIDMEPRNKAKKCLDVATFYNGPSINDPVLGEVCGQEVDKFVSSGNYVVMIFETNDYDPKPYSGLRLRYRAVNRSELEEEKTIGAGTIAAGVVPAIIIYGLVFIVVYKRCKYHREARRMAEQEREGQRDALVAVRPDRRNNNSNNNNSTSSSNGRARRQRQRHQNGGGGGGGGSSSNTASLITNNNNNNGDVMTASMISDSTGHSEPRAPTRKGRVRHPAGDHHHHQHLQPGQAGNSSLHRHSPRHRSGSSHLSDGATSSLDRLRGGRQTTVIPSSEYPMDPTGVFYAGDVDENGVLHPPPLAAPTPSLASSNPYLSHVEDDRRSRSSGGRRSPPLLYGHPGDGGGRSSPFLEGGACARSSPQRHRASPLAQNFATSESPSLTYYGMIDGLASPPVTVHTTGDCTDLPVVVDEQPVDPMSADFSGPPPSYEDAATGKYDPKAMETV